MKPAFWSDAKVAALPEGTRLFYIGLWMVADDAGWFRWDAVEVARDLYGYDGRAKRERRASAMFAELTAIGRVVVHPCGHAEVPRLGEHQHLAGSTKQVRTSLNEHLRECVSQSTATPRESPQMPASPRPVKVREGQVMERNGQVSKGKGTRPRAQEGAVATTDEEHLPAHLRVVNVS